VLSAAGAPAAEDAPCVAPRGVWELLRTTMIYGSKTWIGLRVNQGRGDADIRFTADVPYGPHPAQRLDLYLPRDDGFPVVVFVHGGAWISEDKCQYGVVGRYLAQHGVGAAVIEYRKPPAGDVDAELRDVAAAFAWTRRHAVGFGGVADRMFLMGHSAGSHLVATAALQSSYFEREGLGVDAIRGVIALSGTYRIGLNVRLLGVAYAFRFDDWRSVSPADLVRPDAPPFLLLCAAREVCYLRRPTVEFHRRLRECGASSELYVVPGEDHYGEALHIANPGCLQGPRILGFIRSH
jgi:acetyl esterase/lipase